METVSHTAQLETLVMLAHLTHRVFVMPDHLSTELYLLEGSAKVSDFYCFGDVSKWVLVISMQQYLDDRQAHYRCHVPASNEVLRLSWLQAFSTALYPEVTA